MSQRKCCTFSTRTSHFMNIIILVLGDTCRTANHDSNHDFIQYHNYRIFCMYIMCNVLLDNWSVTFFFLTHSFWCNWPCIGLCTDERTKDDKVAHAQLQVHNVLIQLNCQTTIQFYYFESIFNQSIQITQCTKSYHVWWRCLKETADICMTQALEQFQTLHRECMKILETLALKSVCCEVLSQCHLPIVLIYFVEWWHWILQFFHVLWAHSPWHLLQWQSDMWR